MRKMKDQLVGLDPRFNYRGLNQTRIETFSDAVFAFSVTLVVLSSSVPETFEQLIDSFRDIIPFLACVILIVVIWYQHYVFFLRYGLQDTKTVVINTFLLFVLLIYVYPLKFLMTLLFDLYSGFIMGDNSRFRAKYTGDVDMGILMTAYGLGAAFIFMGLAWLYRNAYNKRTELGMDEYEAYLTKVSIWTNLLMSSIPFFSAMIAIIKPFGGGGLDYMISGFSYMLYPPVMMLYGRRISAKIKKMF